MGLIDILSMVGPIVLGGLGYVVKTFMNKIKIIQDEIDCKISEPEARQLIEDKNAVLHAEMSNIRDTLNDIKSRLDKLLFSVKHG